VRVLVCGGRKYGYLKEERAAIFKALYELCQWSEDGEYGNTMPFGITLIHGGASGADAIANEWAVVNWIPIEDYPADWKAYGRAGGPIRNQRMIDEGKPDLVLAFPGGPGTADMVRRAKAANVKVIEH
jgi:hypothetical protein